MLTKLLTASISIGICCGLFLINKKENTISELKNEITDLRKKNIFILNNNYNAQNRLLHILSMQDVYNKLLLDNNMNNINCNNFYYKEYVVCAKLFKDNEYMYDYTHYYRPRFINLMLDNNYDELSKLIANGFDIFMQYKSNGNYYDDGVTFFNTNKYNTEHIDNLDYISLLYDKKVIMLIDNDMLENLLKKCLENNILNVNHISNIKKIIEIKKY